jgi:hypothetical protein
VSFWRGKTGRSSFLPLSMLTLSFQEHPRKVSHGGDGNPRRYRTDETFEASELGCLLDP